MKEIKTPELLVNMLESLQISPAKKKQLNKALANQTRKHFRSQIKKQRDIYNVPYAPRRRRRPMYIKLTGEKVYRQNMDQGRNMLSGLSRMLMVQSDETSFSVGLAGLPGIIGQTHNEGELFTYVTRINAWFNHKTNRWEGGRKSHLAARMPMRTFIGWTPALAQEITHTIMQHMEPET